MALRLLRAAQLAPDGTWATGIERAGDRLQALLQLAGCLLLFRGTLRLPEPVALGVELLLLLAAESLPQRVAKTVPRRLLVGDLS